MYRLIGEALQALTPDVAKGEIKGSYCPGDYDLSISGRKFCGIAQRRQAHAFAVQAFVVVRGSGRSKAELARSFYQIAAEGADSLCFPNVTEDSVASLEELIGLADERQFVDAVKGVVRARKQEAVVGQAALRLPDDEEIAAMVQTLKSRYGLGEVPL
jgi:octanoyl-[GcvH]:protein N-octanoyltransferase